MLSFVSFDNSDDFKYRPITQVSGPDRGRVNLSTCPIKKQLQAIAAVYDSVLLILRNRVIGNQVLDEIFLFLKLVINSLKCMSLPKTIMKAEYY